MRLHRNFGLRPFESNTHPIVDVTLVIVCWVIIAAFVLMFFWFYSVNKARAHEWYPAGCCSGTDCAPLDPSRVKSDGNGYIIDGRYTVAPGDVKDSLDGRYHGCFPQPENLLCFFAPKPSM